MTLRSLAFSAAFCLLGLSSVTGAASAAELAVPSSHMSRDVVGGGYVLWDDVYPPAPYGPRPRPVEEVQALRADRRPVSSLWWGYWYVR